MKQLKDYLPFYLGCECVFEDCRNGGDKEQGKLIEIGINMACIETANNDDPYIECTPNEIKPILRPLSDITEGEKMDLRSHFLEMDNPYNTGDPPWHFEQTRYLLSKHFDLFGLIESGLAIDKNTLK